MGLWSWAPVPGKHPCHRFLLLYDEITTMVRACHHIVLFTSTRSHLIGHLAFLTVFQVFLMLARGFVTQQAIYIRFWSTPSFHKLKLPPLKLLHNEFYEKHFFTIPETVLFSFSSNDFTWTCMISHWLLCMEKNFSVGETKSSWLHRCFKQSEEPFHALENYM